MSENRIKQPQLLTNLKHLIEYLIVGGQIKKIVKKYRTNTVLKYYIDHNKLTEKQISPELFDIIQTYGLIKEIEGDSFEGTIKPKIKLMF